ncbi:MAG: HAMP domain-containing histidine kinase [Deltaproteobacteria bacterium]|nr:HAMP domain-containing histidine kinase [Deltaproteobacteria bacterium]
MSVFVLLVAGGAFLVVLGLPLWRLSPRGGGKEWAFAWSALFSSGLALRFSESNPALLFVYPVLGTLFAGLLYAGARRYSARPLPREFWLGAGTVALVRGGLSLFAPQPVTTLGAAAIVSLAAALAARDIRSTRDRRPGGSSELLLVIGLGTLIVTSCAYEWMVQSGGDRELGFFLWLVSGCFVAGTQIAAIFDQYRAELELRLVERSEQLRASLVRLEEQQRLVAVGTLAAGIAHQINNPIGAIAAAAQYALIAGEDDDAAAIREEALSTVVDEARRCGRIVRSVLQFARDEPTPKWVESLNPVVVRACEQTRDYVEERGGRLELRLADEPLAVRMSPIDLEQVVVNLIRNGAESRKDGANVEVATVGVDDEAWLLVVDDGDGIDPTLRTRVLEPFFTTRLAEGGSGLGLSVVHGIVQSHGGALELDGLPAGGTRICVRLPLAVGDAEPTAGSRRGVTGGIVEAR